MECCLCGEAVPAGVLAEAWLAEHVLRAHAGSRLDAPGHRGLTVWRPSLPHPVDWVQCWCGDVCPRTSWAGHLRDGGGLAAHVLAVILG
jgi:hypothetical protein